MDEKRLSELEDMAKGTDHLEYVTDGLEHVFLGGLLSADAPISGVARDVRRDVCLNPRTVRLLREARHAVPELVAEVRRLRELVRLINPCPNCGDLGSGKWWLCHLPHCAFAEAATPASQHSKPASAGE